MHSTVVHQSLSPPHTLAPFLFRFLFLFFFFRFFMMILFIYFCVRVFVCVALLLFFLVTPYSRLDQVLWFFLYCFVFALDLDP
ncbi:hypothetical protein BKA57DRAFT_477732 [Linnemannia elongata]|nr:hypothetical protein BKA57DRAFT_477732 [Linnemannia elongata]